MKYLTVVQAPVVTVYDNTCTPTPAAVAENTPPVTPLPLQVPPAGLTLVARLTSVSVKHTLGGKLVNIMFGKGLTVMVNVEAAPTQPAADTGVIVIVAVIGDVVGLIATNAGMVPVPLAPRPMLVLLFVQVYTVPATGPPIVTAVVNEPAHTDWLAIAVTDGVGFTVMVKVTGVPAQPAADGVTVIVAVIGAAVVLVAVNAAILPVPLAARPMAVLLFVQL